ncbi:hypothetical protein Y032_0095g2854 [Ancylostoma ceylanicum]|nr:hypothetical protein Y032_0095g2854 [Ancylostoma ceylanicum]
MIKLSLIAVAVASLLPALGEGKPVVFVPPQCLPSGHLDRNTIESGVITPINERRLKLPKGEQKNGLDGGLLPPATNMTLLAEQTVRSELSPLGCSYFGRVYSGENPLRKHSTEVNREAAVMVKTLIDRPIMNLS